MGGKATAEIPKWVDTGSPDEVRAFRAGVRAGRAGEEMPQSGKFYVIVYAGWVHGKELRQQGGRKGRGRKTA